MLILISINILDIVLDLIDVKLFSFPTSGIGCNVIIFGMDMRSSGHVDKKKCIF